MSHPVTRKVLPAATARTTIAARDVPNSRPTSLFFLSTRSAVAGTGWRRPGGEPVPVVSGGGMTKVRGSSGTVTWVQPGGTGQPSGSGYAVVAVGSASNAG